jgi:hypothetical protein
MAKRLNAPKGATDHQLTALWAAAQAEALSRVAPRRVMGAVSILAVWLCMWADGPLSAIASCLMLGGIHGLVLKVSALYHHPFAAITNALTGRVPAILLGFASDVSGVIGAEVAVVLFLYAAYITCLHGCMFVLNVTAAVFCVGSVFRVCRLDTVFLRRWATSAQEVLRRGNASCCEYLLSAIMFACQWLLVYLVSGPITVLHLATYILLLVSYETPAVAAAVYTR